MVVVDVGFVVVVVDVGFVVVVVAPGFVVVVVDVGVEVVVVDVGVEVVVVDVGVEVVVVVVLPVNLKGAENALLEVNWLLKSTPTHNTQKLPESHLMAELPPTGGSCVIT